MHRFVDSKYFRVLLIFIILTQVFMVVFQPHQGYKYPFHADEWFHISEAKNIITGGTYTKEVKFEIGFDLFLAFLIKLGFDLVLVYKYLPAVFACISSLALFLLVNRLTKKFYLAVLSMLFFMILPTNTNILGLKFFTPLTLAIPLIYLFILLFVKGFKEKKIKFIYYSSFVFLILFFIHPVSATFMLPVILVYIIPYIRFIKKNKFRLSFLVIFPLAFILVYTFIFKLGLYDILVLIKQYSMFYKGWTTLEINYSIISLYKPLPFLLAALGFFLVLREKKLRIFIIWASITAILLITFTYFDVSLFAPYQRMLYYFMLSAVPLSAVGLYRLLSYLQKFIPKTFAIWLTVILIELFFLYHVSLNNAEREQFYYAINDEAYEAIKFLEPLEKGRVIAPRGNLSIGVQPISGQRVLATQYFYGNENYKSDLDRFFGASCSVKEEIINKYKVMYVIDWENCGWEKIYDKEFKIYKTGYKKLKRDPSDNVLGNKND